MLDSPFNLDEAVTVLRRGGVVAFSSPSSYGLAADIGSREALARLVALKGRMPDHPFPVLVEGAEMAARWCRRPPPPGVESLLDSSWGVPVTLVVPAAPHVAPEVTGPDHTIALRRAVHPVESALVRAAGVALTATSANPTGAPPFARQVELSEWLPRDGHFGVLAGEEPWNEAPSTLLNMAAEPPQVLRQGTATLQQVLDQIG